MHKKVFLTAVLALSLLMGHGAVAFAEAPPGAQSEKQFDDKLEDFKKKMAAKRAVTTQLKDDDKTITPVNPLGPAGNLPLKRSATANALGAPASPEELQAKMDAEAAEQLKKIEQQTFDAALKQIMPLRADQIRTTYQKFEESRKAAETPLKIPEMKTQIETISLDPSQAPVVIKTVPSYITTISFVDSSGAPWPIQDLSYTGDFEITPPEGGGNILRMTPNSAHGVGNMSVRFVDLSTPIIFFLTTSLDIAYVRFEGHIAKKGPLAKTPIIEFGGLNTVAGTDPNLVSVLDGVMPSGAEKLRVQGVDGRTTAWRLSGKVYLRTPLSLLSPAWESSVASSDGTTVYTMNDTPVIILSDEGRMVRAHIAAADEVSP
jgi:intracellular multiplication protein IcmK